MLVENQLKQTLAKLERFENTLERLLFIPVAEIEMEKYQTKESLDHIPEDSFFIPAYKGDTWGGEGMYGWFKGQYTVPEQYAGKNLYLRPNIGGYEGMLWVNGVPHGIFSTKITVNSHGNHYCDMLKKNVVAGETLDIAIEYYAHHYVMGTYPFACEGKSDFMYTYNGAEICLKNDELCDF